MAANTEEQPWFLRTSYPVELPYHAALTKPRADFDEFVASELKIRGDVVMSEEATPTDKAGGDDETEESFTIVGDSEATGVQQGLERIRIASTESESTVEPETHPEVAAEESDDVPMMENKMLTENGDVTYRTSTDALVDLFSELEDTITGPALRDALEAAWCADPPTTLGIIFNSRSIHLGKSSRITFYRAAGWLAQNHPLTLVTNLQWLCRPVIEKKARKTGDKDDDDDDVVVVEAKDLDGRAAFDVKHGVSHGYWKDLLNLLALAVNDQLDVLSDPHKVLNVADEVVRATKIALRARKQGAAKGRPSFKATRGGRKPTRGGSRFGQNKAPSTTKAESKSRDERHRAVVHLLSNDAVYRVLHLTVARLFAEQLQIDLEALSSADAKVRNSVSLCGKWAPSHGNFHDRHTFVASSIAEIMHPQETFAGEKVRSADRETYLRHAREQYRRNMSALRKHLQVVERDITACTFENIQYDRVPSLAMNNYTTLFARKDFKHFEGYLAKVAEGKATISGATLLPSTLMLKAQEASRHGVKPHDDLEQWEASCSAEALVEMKLSQVAAQVVNGQWNTLVQRIKDSGTLSSSIAVCDVSGSMCSPVFRDQTTPMHSAIGLSLLIAEAAEAPFAGSFITFSEHPEIQTVDLSATLVEKYARLSRAEWGMNTDFAAVFERLLLPLAQKHKLRPEQMVKRVFVFSDMQFDTAQQYERGITQWSSSYERISALYKEEGYEMPELVFWNLAGGGRAGASGPKPVMATDEGTCLVSGYSQGMLKVFLENGAFDTDDAEAEATVVVTKEEDGQVTDAVEKKAVNPVDIVRKAVGHKAYQMLRVMD
jgi:hypothetical protein